MKKRQRGMTTVEAAIGAALMLIILFGTIEIARAIFVWNFLDEVTRRGARVAAVCPIPSSDATALVKVKRAAIFADPDSTSADKDKSPHVNQLDINDINIEYLGADGLGATTFESVRFVRASIPSFQLPLLFFNQVTITTPDFRTILPSESLGYNPDADTFECDF